jgi:uncharacterized protein
VLAAALALTGCGDDGEATSSSPAPPATEAVMPAGFQLDEVTITSADGEDSTVPVWIADSSEDRRRGLMDVTDLGEAEGMLFVFDSAALHRFYMWRTPMPLDIAFLDADGTFVGSASMEPCLQPSAAGCERYAPDVPYLMALEVPTGALDDLGIEAGTHVRRS